MKTKTTHEEESLALESRPGIQKVRLNRPQLKFINLEKVYKVFVAGYGSGKTFVGCVFLLLHFLKHPRINAGYFAPVFSDVTRTFYPTIEEVAALFGMEIVIKKGEHIVEVFLNGRYYGKIYCFSMDNPFAIKGFKIGCALVDEIDTMAKRKAHDAWKRICARMRYSQKGVPNNIAVTTTPEGFNFVYEQFVKKVKEDPSLESKYGIVQASTYENLRNLPPNYIENLLTSYPENLKQAYINGQFVNLVSGSVYTEFDRFKNRSTEIVEKTDLEVHIGMDFNIRNMSAITHVLRDGNPHAVEEFTGVLDTPAMIRTLKNKYWEKEANGAYKRTRRIIIYPDASGKAGSSTAAGVSDISLLMDAGFVVRAPSSNPRVRDRVNSMNGLFCNSLGERRYHVNTTTCPVYTDDLEQQAYDAKGDPDKKSGNDHRPDAAGYYIHYCFPIVKRPKFAVHSM